MNAITLSPRFPRGRCLTTTTHVRNRARCTAQPFDEGSSIPDASEADTVGLLDDYLYPGCPAYDRLVNNTNPLVAFAPITTSGQPNLMSVRMSDKLDVLAQTVAGDPRFAGLQVYVISA